MASLRAGWLALKRKYDRWQFARAADKAFFAKRLRPHQGKRECARRREQIANGHHDTWAFNRDPSGRPVWTLIFRQRDWRRQSVVV